MQDEHSYEQYYQAILKQHLRKILIIAAILLSAGAIYEINDYMVEQKRLLAQASFEQYLASPNKQTVTTLEQNAPKSIQTQLVKLLEAKQFYSKKQYNETEQSLTYVVNHSTHKGIKSIAAYRLSMLYRELNQLDKARSVLALVEQETAYATLQEALTLPEYSTERMDKLNEALKLSPSAYEKQLIAIAQHKNIEPS